MITNLSERVVIRQINFKEGVDSLYTQIKNERKKKTTVYRRFAFRKIKRLILADFFT